MGEVAYCLMLIHTQNNRFVTTVKTTATYDSEPMAPTWCRRHVDVKCDDVKREQKDKRARTNIKNNRFVRRWSIVMHPVSSKPRRSQT